MSFSPARIRKFDSSPIASCRLDYVVTPVSNEGTFVVWEVNTQCCGSRGIFPTWLNMPSTCSGPTNCHLLLNGNLFYPPDRRIWLPVVDMDVWGKIKIYFEKLDLYDLPDEILVHIKEQQCKWGIVDE